MADILALTCGSVTKKRVMLGIDCIGPGAGVGDDIETQKKAVLIIRNALVSHVAIADAEINLSACLIELEMLRM